MSDDKTDPVNKSFDRILHENENSAAQVTEPFFRKNLLPLIAEEHENSDLTPWLMVVGSWRRPIDVIEPQSKEILFRVPALVGENDLPFKQGPRSSVSDIVQNARRKMEAIPRAGTEYLKDRLGRRVNIPNNRKKAAQQWLEIYRRYGLDHLIDESMEGEDDQQQMQSTQRGDDIFDGYEEL